MRTEYADHIELSLPYQFAPRSYQWAIWDAWDAGVRRFLETWHRRAGKDKTLLNFCIERMLERVGNYFHIFPKQNQGRRIIWTGIDRDGRSYLDHFPPDLIFHRNNSDMLITFRDPQDLSQPGSTYQVLGTDRNLDVLVGANPVGVIFSEYALQNPRAWDLCRPILRENGGWAAFIQTPRGKNHGYRLYQQVRNNPEWHVGLLTVDDTRRDGPDEDGSPVVSAADIAADRAEGMTQDLIEQEYFCSFEAAIPGAYYAHEFRLVDHERRITRVPYDPSYGVYTFWDIGVDDHTAIWCAQFIGRTICLVHEYHDSGHGLPHYAHYLSELPYQGNYRGHLLPHDGRVREWGSGERREATAGRLLQGVVRSVQRLGFSQGISAVRTMFPRLLFDEIGCEAGIDALRTYHHAWDEQRQVFTQEEEHDWASHPAAALRTLASGLGVVDALEKQWQGQPPTPVTAPPVSLWDEAATGEARRTSWMG